MKIYTITQEQMDRLYGAAHGGATLIDVTAKKILDHWRSRFPNNMYAWPGAPEDFAHEAAKVLMEGNEVGIRDGGGNG